MKLSTITLSILLLTPLAASADRQYIDADRQYIDGEYTKHVFTDSRNQEMPYRLLSPDTVATGQTYPLVVFLHGSGERGDDNVSQLEHGAGIFADPVNLKKYPSFVLFPQCKDKSWVGQFDESTFIPGAAIPPLSDTEQTLVDLVEQIKATNPIDPSRIYIMGLSMGGIATYDLVCRFPELFAAAIPICGAVNPQRLVKARDVSFMIFHGAKDKEVPIICGRSAYNELSSLGANVEYVEFPDEGHDCWDSAFEYPEFLPWLYSQSKENKAEMASAEPK